MEAAEKKIILLNEEWRIIAAANAIEKCISMAVTGQKNLMPRGTGTRADNDGTVRNFLSQRLRYTGIKNHNTDSCSWVYYKGPCAAIMP